VLDRGIQLLEVHEGLVDAGDQSPQFPLGFDIDLLVDPAIGHVLGRLRQLVHAGLGIPLKLFPQFCDELFQAHQALVEAVPPGLEIGHEGIGAGILRLGIVGFTHIDSREVLRAEY